MPAQPPFLTPTRTPTTGLAAFAITYLMRSAAASVSRITCGRGRGVAIGFRSFSLCSLDVCYLNVGSIDRQRNSPHVEHTTCLVGHAALVPGRIPDDIDFDLADTGHARHRVLDHDRQLLRRGTIGRRERHVDGDRPVVGEVDLV